MRTPITVAAVAATGLLLVGGGTALALGHGSGTEPAPVATTSAASALPPELGPPAAAPAPAVDRAAAERIALDAAGGGRVTSTEFDRADDRDDDRDDLGDDRYDDRDHWEVEVQTGGVEHDVDVDAATGQVLGHETDGDDRDDHDD